jgi:hypothetical protein
MSRIMARQRKASALTARFSPRSRCAGRRAGYVLGEPSAAAEPSKPALHDPALGQRHEARAVAALDDLQPPSPGPGDRLCRRLALVSAVGEDHRDEGEQPAGSPQERHDPIPVLDIGGMDDGRQKEAQRVDQDVALLALDLFTRVVTCRIKARPPFSALFTLWLSTIAAVGLASLPTCSRAWTKSA